MFEQTSRLAEKVAASVSRRGFLGSLGGWAAAAALGLAGLLSSPGEARADGANRWCFYVTSCASAPIICHGVQIGCPYVFLCIETKQSCPATYNGLSLGSTIVHPGCLACGGTPG